jgi:hypothetical protein
MNGFILTKEYDEIQLLPVVNEFWLYYVSQITALFTVRH